MLGRVGGNAAEHALAAARRQVGITLLVRTYELLNVLQEADLSKVPVPGPAYLAYALAVGPHQEPVRPLLVGDAGGQMRRVQPFSPQKHTNRACVLAAFRFCENAQLTPHF
jgi:hypothetical protein